MQHTCTCARALENAHCQQRFYFFGLFAWGMLEWLHGVVHYVLYSFFGVCNIRRPFAEIPRFRSVSKTGGLSYESSCIDGFVNTCWLVLLHPTRTTMRSMKSKAIHSRDIRGCPGCFREASADRPRSPLLLSSLLQPSAHHPALRSSNLFCV